MIYNIDNLKKKSVKKLKEICKESCISRYSNLKKKELIHLIMKDQEDTNKFSKNNLGKKKNPELKEICKELGISGYSKITKSILIEKIIEKKILNDNESGNITPDNEEDETDISENENEEDDLELFFKKFPKDKNDLINKRRELILKKLIEDKLIVNKRKYRDLKKNINIELKKYCPDNFTRIKCELKAGRKNNYDFDIIYYNDKELIKQIKLEFKYGVNSITKYPEFYSLYCKTLNIFNNKDYIQYFYKNIDIFISTFPDDISKNLIENKPSYSEYLKIVNDTKYKHKFQEIIYKYSKETGNNISFKKFINQQISDFLKDLKIEDFKFEKIKDLILDTQKNKVFLFIHNDKVNSEIIDNKLIMTNNFHIKNNNTIVFKSTEENYSIDWLLRWKNHKGCSVPGWQISLKSKK